MTKKYDKFVCTACNKTSVIRPKSQMEMNAPKCASCSEGTGGVSEMEWVGTVTEDDGILSIAEDEG